MYLRNKDEALAALATLFEIPERSSQIVQSTVLIALCLDPEARALMMDVQAAVLSGGLDAFRKRREEALARLTETKIQRRAPGIDVRKDALLDEIGTALDLLKMVSLLAEVFPAVAQRHPKWELARFIHEQQGFVREAVEAGLRRRGRPEHAATEARLLARLEERKPWWPEWAESMRQACLEHVRVRALQGETHPAASDGETLFHVLAMSESRAREVLRRMAMTSQELHDYLASIRARMNLVLLAQQEAVS